MNNREVLDHRLLSMVIQLVNKRLNDFDYDLGRYNPSKTNPDEYPHKVIVTSDAGYVTVSGNDTDCIYHAIYDVYLAIYDVIGLRLFEVENIENKLMSKIKALPSKDPKWDLVFDDDFCKYEAVVDLRELVDVVKEV